MTARSWHTILNILALLPVLLGYTKADEFALRNSASSSINVTTSLVDYISQNDRQYLAQLASYASRIADFRAGYQRQLDTINYNKDLLEIRLVEFNQQIYPLEVLNELTKHCVQQYSSLLVSTETVRSNFLSCINQATYSLNSILSSPEYTQRYLNSYYTSNWKKGLKDCEQKNNASYTNYTLCVVQLVGSTNVYFNTNQRTFNTQLDASRCSADTRIRQTVECVFPTINSTLSAVGEAARLIDDCIAGVGLCEPCNDNTNSTIHGSECPNVINIVANSQTYQNTTIRNPFFGLNSSMECILVNFLQPN